MNLTPAVSSISPLKTAPPRNKPENTLVSRRCLGAPPTRGTKRPKIDLSNHTTTNITPTGEWKQEEIPARRKFRLSGKTRRSGRRRSPAVLGRAAPRWTERKETARNLWPKVIFHRLSFCSRIRAPASRMAFSYARFGSSSASTAASCAARVADSGSSSNSPSRSERM